MRKGNTPSVERFHIRVRKWRTTVSLDYYLAGLLAAKLGLSPGTAEAHRGVRAWLQGHIDESASSGLNRLLMRRALLTVSDNILSTRCALWLESIGDFKAVVHPMSTTLRTPLNELTLRSSGKETKKERLGRFVLYCADPGGAIDVADMGNSVEQIRRYIERLDPEDVLKPHLIHASLITTEKQVPREYYIRECTEECWKMINERQKKRQLIHPVVDANGILLSLIHI